MKIFSIFAILLVTGFASQLQAQTKPSRAIGFDPEIYSFFVIDPNNDSLYFIHYIPQDVLDQFEDSDVLGLHVNGHPIMKCSIEETYHNKTDLSFKSGKTYIYNFALFCIGKADEFLSLKSIPFEILVLNKNTELKAFQIGMYQLTDDKMYYYVENKWVRR